MFKNRNLALVRGKFLYFFISKNKHKKYEKIKILNKIAILLQIQILNDTYNIYYSTIYIENKKKTHPYG